MVQLPDGVNLEKLLAPIPGDPPQGADLRKDFSPQSLYFRLRDERSSAREAERARERGVDEALGEKPPDPAPHWRQVSQLAVSALTERTKDLEIAAWFTEALLRLNALPGLAAGALLITGLVEQFWDGLFPLPDEYGIETRVAPVGGLSGRGGSGSLIGPLYLLGLFEGDDGSPVTFFQYKQAEERVGSDAAGFEALDAQARRAGAASFGRLHAAARDALDAWRAMSAAIEARAGRDAPATSEVARLLDQIISIARRYAPAETPAASADAAPSGAEPQGAATAQPAAPQAGGVPVSGITTREQALRALSEIASFFRRTEPHSPLSYTLDEAVRRGRLTLPELLAEIVQEESSRHAILTSLGIRPPPPPEG